MKKILSLLLLLGSFIVAQADDLTVCGVTVDLTKSGQITGTGISGQVYYDASQRMLKLTDATITTDLIGIAANVSPGSIDFRIYLSGKNVINSGRVSVRADNNILFCGNGDLELNGPGNFINKCKMTVYACRLTVNSTGDDAFHSMDNGKADLVLSYHGALKATCNGTVLKNFNDITYNTGKLLSGSPTGKEMMIGDDYKLEIGGIKVTPFNRDNVSGSNIQGKVSVSFLDNFNSVKVSLDNATISGSNYGIDFSDKEKPITLALKGNNAITATTRGLTSPTGSDCRAYNIEGKGTDKLTITAATGISHQGDVKVKDCVLDINGRSYGMNLWDYGKLTVDNATLHAKATYSGGVAIGKLKDVTYLNGCTETEPLRASYDQRNNSISLGAADPNEMLSEVTIEPTYGVIVCCQILKKSMGTSTFSITGEGIKGSVTYNPKQNCLTLTDGAELGLLGKFKEHAATIEVLDFNQTAVPDFSRLTISSEGNGHNRINDKASDSRASAIYSSNDITISGNAPLDIESHFGIILNRAHNLVISLEADFTDQALNSAVGADTYYSPLYLSPGRSATYTYRFKSEIKPVFNRLESLNMNNGFTLISPFGATYDERKRGIVSEDGSLVMDKWVVFGYPRLAEGCINVADADPFIKNHRIYPFLNLDFSTWCIQFYEAWQKEKHDIMHIYKTKHEALTNYYTHELNWDGEIDLAQVLALHGNIDGDTDISIDPQEKGYTWKFKLENYELKDYDPTIIYSTADQSNYAWLDGNVLKACCITKDGERDSTRQSRSSIGAEPLLKVLLLDQNGEVVTGGYIKFRIGEVRKDVEVKISLSEATKVSSGTETEYCFDFEKIEKKVIDEFNKRATSISRAEFETNYCFAVNSSAPQRYFETTLREYLGGYEGVVKPIQRYVRYGGKWLQSELLPTLVNLNDPGRLGTFQMPISGDNYHFGWILSDSQRDEMGYERVAMRLYNEWLAFPDVYVVFSVNDIPEGDTNLDGVVDVADVATVVSAMASGIYNSDYDVNGDGVIDVADIATIISIMAKQ